MIDRVSFALEMANELNKSNFSAVNPLMAEYATALAVGGIQCGQANMLADVYNPSSRIQYSVKTFRDDFIKLYMNEKIEYDRFLTDYIIERRISGVADPNADPLIVMQAVIDDLHKNELKSKVHYNADQTNTVLVGYSDDDDYFYFRLTEMDYHNEVPYSVQEKQFTPNSKNFQVFEGNRSAIVGKNEDGTTICEWVHPNCSTYTRCYKKRYFIDNEDSFYFKVRKQDYVRPTNNALMQMIEIG